MPDAGLRHRVAAVRRFNRFYTKQIGVLQQGLLRSPFSLTEVRVLYELAHRPEATAAELVDELGVDPGYLSRIIRRFQSRGLLTRTRSSDDARRRHVRLTRRGRAIFARLDAEASAEVAAMLRHRPVELQRRLLEAMSTIERVLSPPSRPHTGGSPPYVLRLHRPGDMGWVVHRHGVLYAEEYGWDERFEALVAAIVARFIQRFDPERERCWIAERDGEILGSVFLVKRTKTIAQLRLLLVEPSARGLGLGSHLVSECGRFAREAGYRKVMLWTNDVLEAARRIYERAGYRLVHEEPHRSFGPELIGQTWELVL